MKTKFLITPIVLLLLLALAACSALENLNIDTGETAKSAEPTTDPATSNEIPTASSQPNPAGSSASGQAPLGEPPAPGDAPTGDAPQMGGQPPTGAEPPSGGQPPAEAISACNNLSENDACRIDTPQGTLEGSCLTIQSQLACVPAGGPGGMASPDQGAAVDQQPGSSAQSAPPSAGQSQTAPSGSAASTAAQPVASGGSGSYVIVDTGQHQCYDNNLAIACPESDEAFYGQDAQYADVQPRYQDNGDGTVTDLNTGLMWQQDPGEKMTYSEAAAGASSFNLAGYSDWRLPTIKELYSLIDFSGLDVSRCAELGACNAVPFIDTDYFEFEYGDTAAGERTIDSQWATSSLYVSDVMNGQQAMFGVNFADGRIKGYGIDHGKTFFVIYVRGATNYGLNDFVDNGDNTVSDLATGLTWTQADSGTGLDWQNALNYCENLDYAGYDDWRLPNAKELHSIVDYSRSPDTSNSAAIDPIFETSSITNEAGQLDYPAFWSSTTHVTSEGNASSAVYIAFGEALGYMNGTWMDVHGAGAQRADAKSGDPSQLPVGRGPQGDAMRIYNYARCVRDGAEYVQVTDSGTAGVAGQAPAGDQAPNADQAGPIGDQMPTGDPPRAGAQPPAEAVSACSGLSESNSCQFNTPRGSVNGVCTLVQNQLACVPSSP